MRYSNGKPPTRATAGQRPRTSSTKPGIASLEACQLRTTVASVLADLQVACQQLLSRLELDVGSMEIDRRARDRATSVSPRKKRATSIRSTP